ncbi:MAG: HAMP domain-containing sensor histidine kinase [Acetobacteraceae bacterium]
MGEETLEQSSQPQAIRWSLWLQIAIYLLCAGAFTADLLEDVSIAFGVFYIPLVATAVGHKDRRAPWILACIATALVSVGFFTPRITSDIAPALLNRLLSIAAIFTTAYLIHHERHVREQLDLQVSRAEAADQVRVRLFNNLSHELRTPLAAILGFADLLLAGARPDQQSALGHIQAGGRRLLATVDNLIDLTQIEQRRMRSRPLDLAAVLAHAVEVNRPLASERHITVSLGVMGADTRVLADGWALRRIIDNLIANGIKFSEPGGIVEVSARLTTGGIAAIVRDTGPGMPARVLEQLGEPFFQADSGIARRFEGMGTGLALSLRLADAMGAALLFDSVPGKGTIASLVLPADQRRQASR